MSIVSTGVVRYTFLSEPIIIYLVLEQTSDYYLNYYYNAEGFAKLVSWFLGLLDGSAVNDQCKLNNF